MDRVISELCYKPTILQRCCRKMTINGNFLIIPFLKLHGENKKEATTFVCFI